VGLVCGNPNLCAVNPAGAGLDLLRPLAARGFVQHVARHGVVVDPHFLPEPAAQQSGGGHSERLSSEVPQRHLDAAGGAHQVVRRTIGARATEVLHMLIEQRVDGVDFQRVLAHQPRLHRQDLFLDADPRRSVCFGDPI
jgi:hypothetical protein